MLQKRLYLGEKPTVWTAPLNMPRRIKKYPLKWLYKGGDRKIPLDKQVLLCNGRIGKEKGTDELLELFGLMYAMGFRVALIFIGGGNISKYRKIADALPNDAGKYVSFFGSLPHDRLLALTLAGGPKRIGKVVGISLSMTETQGLVIHEMWWLALAVAVMADTCFSDDIDRGGGGVLLKGSLAEQARMLISFLSDSKRLREYGVKGQQYVREYLSAEKCGEAFLDYCTSVILAA
jgi:glycosyltransferase involved in cell wall biosynthesis